MTCVAPLLDRRYCHSDYTARIATLRLGRRSERDERPRSRAVQTDHAADACVSIAAAYWDSLPTLWHGFVDGHGRGSPGARVHVVWLVT